MTSAVSDDDRDPGAGPLVDETPGADDGDAVDLFGNEVSNAVARYQFDGGGSLYEVHSPRTELPRLSPPKG